MKDKKEMTEAKIAEITTPVVERMGLELVSSGLQNFTKNFLKDSADAFHTWSQWAQGNLTFKEALKYSPGPIVTGKKDLK